MVSKIINHYFCDQCGAEVPYDELQYSNNIELDDSLFIGISDSAGDLYDLCKKCSIEHMKRAIKLLETNKNEE